MTKKGTTGEQRGFTVTIYKVVPCAFVARWDWFPFDYSIQQIQSSLSNMCTPQHKVPRMCPEYVRVVCSPLHSGNLLLVPTTESGRQLLLNYVLSTVVPR